MHEFIIFVVVACSGHLNFWPLIFATLQLRYVWCLSSARNALHHRNLLLFTNFSHCDIISRIISHFSHLYICYLSDGTSVSQSIWILDGIIIRTHPFNHFNSKIAIATRTILFDFGAFTEFIFILNGKSDARTLCSTGALYTSPRSFLFIPLFRLLFHSRIGFELCKRKVWNE